MIICQLIQVILNTGYTLKEYYQKVKGKGYDILELLDIPLDFKGRCPICGGKGCPQFIGYYYRGVIDEDGT